MVESAKTAGFPANLALVFELGKNRVNGFYSTLTREGGRNMSGAAGYGAGFALIVVLFILLIIVGAAWVW